ncbi:MAG: AAA family ATPase [Candidatus Helarchaeota archaeon]
MCYKESGPVIDDSGYLGPESKKDRNNLIFSTSVRWGVNGSIIKQQTQTFEKEISTLELKVSKMIHIPIKRMSSQQILERLATLGEFFDIDVPSIVLKNEKYNSVLYAKLGFCKDICVITVTINSPNIEEAKCIEKDIFSIFSDITQLDVCKIFISWFYETSRGLDYTTIEEVIDDEILQESYPYLENLDEYVQSYLNSDEKILMLMGPPGTGKTRLIRYILKNKFNLASNKETNHENVHIYYTNDSKVLESDYMFISFLSDSNLTFLILEDIDFSLTKRSSGNTIMYKLLNASDGLIQNLEKKIIISTNLELTTDIDEALIRPGRCFDIIKTRKLSIDEGNKFLKKMRSNKKVEEELTLAELYKLIISTSNINIKTKAEKIRKNIGFMT